MKHDVEKKVFWELVQIMLKKYWVNYLFEISQLHFKLSTKYPKPLGFEPVTLAFQVQLANHYTKKPLTLW